MLIARVGGVRRWTSNQPRVLVINLVEILVGPRRQFITGQLGAFNRGPRRMLSSGSEDLVETSTRKQDDDIIAGAVNVYQIRSKAKKQNQSTSRSPVCNVASVSDTAQQEFPNRGFHVQSIIPLLRAKATSTVACNAS